MTWPQERQLYLKKIKVVITNLAQYESFLLKGKSRPVKLSDIGIFFDMFVCLICCFTSQSTALFMSGRCLDPFYGTSTLHWDAIACEMCFKTKYERTSKELKLIRMDGITKPLSIFQDRPSSTLNPRLLNCAAGLQCSYFLLGD